MPRVKNGTIHRARRKKVLKLAKGYFGSKHRLYRTAKEQVMHSLSYAYRDRRQKKRDFRKLWITRINAACRENNISYSKFINGLNKAGITINRKMLSEIAIDNPEHFTNLVKVAKDALEGKVLEAKKVEVKKAEEPKKTQEAKKETTTDLSELTVVKLRELAKEKAITGYSTMKKAELIDALK
ncbi:MAG TPA: 50S ribosomal protein L20 [Mollicutes bacterium]|jgi:large subunit ribosomal protein L20|nr:50S ribosomal protein L20 [Mollicutes bacterium]